MKQKRKQVIGPALGQLNADNYRGYARAVIEKYGELNLPVDMMLWSQIIRYYEAEIASLKALAHADGDFG